MRILSTLKFHASKWLWSRSLAKTHSRGEWRSAARYTDYRDAARRGFKPERPLDERFLAMRAEYLAKDFTSIRTEETTRLLESLRNRILEAEQNGEPMFGPESAPLQGPGWTKYPEVEALLRGDLGNAFRAVFETEFKVSHGFFDRRSGGISKPKFWHSDSGPGTCLNVFCYFGDGFPENGPTLLLPWQDSLRIFRTEMAFLRKEIARNPALKKDKAAMRACLANFYEQKIAASCQDKVERPNGPAGTIVIFNNNILHAASPPAEGKVRLTLNLRVYPSNVPPDFVRFAVYGLPRKRPYPEPGTAL